jgi:transcriptional regulator with XRE-family HTH domain
MGKKTTNWDLKSIRKRLGYSQGEVSKMVMISQTYLSQIETGQRTPSMDVYNKLAGYYGVPVPILLWSMIDEGSVGEGKKIMFRELKPVIDELIESVFLVSYE